MPDNGDVLTYQDPQVAGKSQAFKPPVGGGSSVVQVVTRTITSAEILALNSTPVELVAAQVGKVLWPISAVFVFHPGATPYDVPADTLNVTTNNRGPGLRTADTLLTEVTERFVFMGGGDGTSYVVSLSSVSGKSLIVDDGGGDPTTGDGTLTVTVLYHVLTL